MSQIGVFPKCVHFGNFEPSSLCDKRKLIYSKTFDL